MQSRRSGDAEVQLQSTEAVNRVLAVAVIYEFLSSDDDQAINIRDVCQRIVTQTQRVAVMPDKQIARRVCRVRSFISPASRPPPARRRANG